MIYAIWLDYQFIFKESCKVKLFGLLQYVRLQTIILKFIRKFYQHLNYNMLDYKLFAADRFLLTTLDLNYNMLDYKQLRMQQ